MGQFLSNGLDISSTEPAVGVALARFFERLMRLGQGMEEILSDVDHMPSEPGLRLAAGFFWLFGQTPSAQSAASGHLHQARMQESRLNARERSWLRALDLWLAKRFDESATAFEEITAEWPDDLPALRAAEFLYYVLGQQYSGPRFLAHCNRLAPRHLGHPDFLAIYAFANELSGQVAQARSLAEHAIAMRAVNPWAQHAMEHVLLWEGSSDTAAALMESWLDQWPDVARTVHCHNAWHVAIMHLDRLEGDRAFAVYDAHVWGRTPDFVVEQLDAIAFLWRCEMAGFAVEGARWESILPYIRPVCDTLFMPFATAHYAYAFARGADHDGLASLLHTVRTRASQKDEEAIRVWRPVGQGIVQASAHLGLGEVREAASLFEPLMPLMTQIGGSDAQDDLFRFAFVESLSRSGHKADATAYLRERLRHKVASPLEEELIRRLQPPALPARQ